MTTHVTHCAYGHDHVAGDGLDDCNAAYATELSRAHARGWHGAGLPLGRCPDCDAGTPATNVRVLPSDHGLAMFMQSVSPCLNCGQSLREHEPTTHGCQVERPDEPRGPLVTVVTVQLCWSPDYDRLTCSCGHTYDVESDDDNASLVGADTHCEACADATATG